MNFLLVFLFLAAVYADMHKVAVTVLKSSGMCDQKSLLNWKRKILTLNCVQVFNAQATAAVGSLVRSEVVLDPELVFASVLTFFDDPKSPLCHYLSYKSIGSLDVFIDTVFSAFSINAQLANFAQLAYFPNDSALMRFYFTTQQVELAKFFAIYSKRAIAKVYSFSYVLELFLYAKLEVYSCPALNEKLTWLFGSKEFAIKVQHLGSDKEQLNYLFFNHLFNDQQLMFAVFDHLLKFKQFDVVMSFKAQFMQARRVSYFEFQDIVFCTALLNYEFDLERVQRFVAPLIHSGDEWDQFVEVVFLKHVIKEVAPSETIEIKSFVQSCNQVFRYVTEMFENPEPRFVAENLVRHLRRALYGCYQLPPMQVADQPELIKKFIARLEQVYGADLDAIKEEFPVEMQQTAQTYELNSEFWNRMDEVLANTEWK